jgi:hypothetical protein
MNMLRRLTDERGIALPMAMMTLLLLTTLMLAFGVLAQTEPIIAANQLRVAQARALAESGMERARWALSEGALNDPDPTGSIAYPMPGSVGVNPVMAPAPYDGSLFMTSSTGGFIVTVQTMNPVANPYVRRIIATGYTPTNSVADTRPKAHRKIQADFEILPDMGLKPPCALCVKGGLDVGGSAVISAVDDVSCGNKVGSLSVGDTNRTGSASLRGADGNTTYNEVGTDYQTAADPAVFDEFTFKQSMLDRLKQLAKLNGTYFGPGYPNGGLGPPVSSPAWDGNITFNSSNQVNNGIVFVDTADGQNIPTDLAAQNPANFANVSIHGSPFTGQPGALNPSQPTSGSTFKGWLVVNGSLSISGNMRLDGMAYAVNDFTYNGTGSGAITGLVVSENIRDVTQTAISDDSNAGGNSRVHFNCANARNTPFVPQGFFMQAGTYREISD